jgi:hypothetical protein
MIKERGPPPRSRGMWTENRKGIDTGRTDAGRPDRSIGRTTFRSYGPPLREERFSSLYTYILKGAKENSFIFYGKAVFKCVCRCL